MSCVSSHDAYQWLRAILGDEFPDIAIHIILSYHPLLSITTVFPHSRHNVHKPLICTSPSLTTPLAPPLEPNRGCGVGAFFCRNCLETQRPDHHSPSPFARFVPAYAVLTVGNRVYFRDHLTLLVFDTTTLAPLFDFPLSLPSTVYGQFKCLDICTENGLAWIGAMDVLAVAIGNQVQCWAPIHDVGMQLVQIIQHHNPLIRVVVSPSGNHLAAWDQVNAAGISLPLFSSLLCDNQYDSDRVFVLCVDSCVI